MKYTILQIPFPRTKAEEIIFCKYAYRSLDSIDYVLIYIDVIGRSCHYRSTLEMDNYEELRNLIKK